MRWRFAAYNPHSAWEFSRKEEIATAFAGYHVLGLSGTKRKRHREDPACCTSQVGTFHIYEWGHSGKSEHAAGVALYLRKQVFRDYNVRRVYDIPSEYQGRMGILRVKRGDCDFCFIVAYPWVHRQTVAEQTRTTSFWKYIDKIVSELPHRCVPIILTDSNAKNGLCRAEHGLLQSVGSPAIGPLTPELENSSGLAFRQMLERQHLCSANSFRGPGHTYFGNVAGVKSRIDHICIPQSLLPCILSCAVMYTLGERLQRVFGPGKRDHMPVNLILQHHSHFSGSTSSQRCVWNTSRLVDGVLRGDRRSELVYQVHQRLDDTHLAQYATFSPTQAVPYPDQIWTSIREAIREPACALYSQQQTKQFERPRDTMAAIQRHQDARASLAALPRSVVQVCDRGHSHQFLSEIFFQWKTSVHFFATRDARDKLLKRDKRQHLADRIVEFNYAVHRHDAANVWKLGRLLSGYKVGPKRRRYDKPQACRPEAADWIQHLSQAGKDGGCSAQEINWETVQHNTLVAHHAPVRTYQQAHSLALADLHSVFYKLRLHKLRRTVPEWAIPGEIWRQLAFPNVFYAPRRLGVGYCDTLDNTLFRTCLYVLFLSIRLYDFTPLEWNLSQTFQIDKANGKTGCAGLRTINTFEPLGKTYVKCLWEKGVRSCDRHWASGYIQHKSRITPIMHRRILKHRLRAVGQSHCDSFYDATNAFPSVVRSVCDQVVDRTCRRCDANILKQRNNTAILCIQAADTKVYLRNGSGSLQGDGHAGEQFLEQYHPTIDYWMDTLGQTEPQDFLVYDPVCEQYVDASVSTYADDLARTVVCDTVHELVHKLQHANRELCTVLDTVGVAQNLDKQEHVPCFVGCHSDSYTREVFAGEVLPGKTCVAARYLGSLHHFRNNDSAEIDNRVQKADIGWYAMGQLWFRQGLRRTALVLIFKGMVYSTLMSGLEALCLSHTHVDRLDKYILKRGRKLMHGAACHKFSTEAGTKYKALPSLEIWRFLYMVPARIELRIRRLKFWQNAAKFPEKYSLLFACLFGQFDFEQHCSIDGSGKPTATANPWLRQFATDIDALGELDSGTFLASQVQGRVLLIFSTFREDFLRIDVTEFRAKFLGHEIPPPEWVPPTLDPQEVFLVPDDTPYVCNLLCADGSMCNQKFATQVQLSAHILHSRGGDHGRRPIYSLAAVSNICPWCRCKYSTRVSASHHIKASFERGQCTGKGSAFNPGILPPKSLQCPVCQEERHSTDDLLQHIAAHDTPAAFFARQNQ